MQFVANRSCAQPSKPEVRFRARDLLLLRVVLDAIEAEDQTDRLLCDRRRRQCLVKVAPQVCVAGGALAARDVRDDVVAAVRVDDQRALRATEELLRRLAAPITCEDVSDVVIAVLVGRDECPHEAVLRLARAIVLHQEPRLVGADDGPHSDLLDESLPQRLGQLARSVQEIVHRRASDREIVLLAEAQRRFEAEEEWWRENREAKELRAGTWLPAIRAALAAR